MIGVAATVLPCSTRNGFSAKVIALLLLVGAILSFVSVEPPVGILALALITCVVVDNKAAMPKPAAANVVDNNSREIASILLFLILFSIGYGIKQDGSLDLFNASVDIQLSR